MTNLEITRPEYAALLPGAIAQVLQ